MNPQTLRYYERRGLIQEPDRSHGDHRKYRPAVVTTLRVIKVAQRLGFTLDEVGELLDTARQRRLRSELGGLQDRAAANLVEVESRISELESISAMHVKSAPNWSGHSSDHRHPGVPAAPSGLAPRWMSRGQATAAITRTPPPTAVAAPRPSTKA